MNEKIIIPRRLSKAWLRDFFGLSHTWALRTEIFTDDILKKIKIEKKHYRTIKVFSIIESKRIKDLLKELDYLD